MNDAAHPRPFVSDLARRTPNNSWRDLERASDVGLTYNGRGAIYQAMLLLRDRISTERTRDTVLVPAFHCPTVVDPILEAGFQVRYYGIDHALMVDTQDLVTQLGEHIAAVVFIRYFGISRDYVSLYAAIRSSGSLVVEDCSHSFLHADPLGIAQSGADFTTFSFWKTIPSQQGGGLLLREGAASSWAECLRRPSVSSVFTRNRELLHLLLKSTLAGSDRKPEIGGRSRKNEPVPAVRRSAAEAYPFSRDHAGWTMPLVARLILNNADLASIASIRRENFQAWALNLKANDQISPVFVKLDAAACPWGFPVLLRNRQDRDFRLHARGVPLFTFGEILHPSLSHKGVVGDAALADSRHLSETLLVLACHQNLRPNVIEKLAGVVNEFVAQLG